MEKFEFKSQVATSIEQSKRLLELGLKKETADCMYSVMTKSYNGHYILEEDRQYNLILFRQEEVQSVGFSHYEHIPAWSLYRIVELIEYNTNIDAIKELLAAKEMFTNNLYTAFINIIEYLIQKGEFNKDYLEEKK